MRIWIAGVTLVQVVLLAWPAGAAAQDARLQLGHLDRLAKVAAQEVNVSVDKGMLKMASAFLDGSDREQAAIKEIMAAVQGIYVRRYEFDREDIYTAADVDAIRSQLKDTRWSRMVSVDSQRERELVEVYGWQEGERIGGMAIIVAEPTELTVVNIVGPLDVDKLRALAGQFGIPAIP